MSYTSCCSPERINNSLASVTLKPVIDPVDLPFRFRNLPKELRFMVYEHALSFSSVDNYFKEYLAILVASPDPNRKHTPPAVQKSCPSILLVSKEITGEALPILHSTPLVLSHGLLGAHLSSVISSTLVRNLKHVTISDGGCLDLDSPPHAAFTGYCFAVMELCTLLRPGHSLRSVKIQFTSNYLGTHLRGCLFDKDKVCGIKSWTGNMLRYLKELRNVGKITIDLEIPMAMKQDVIETMKSPANSFLALPYHIRQKIYGYSVDYNEAINAMRQASKDLAFNKDPVTPVKKTPTIMLISKQINGEAQSLLYNKPLVISDLHPVTNHAMVKLEDYLSLDLLKRINHLEIRLTDFRYLPMLYTIAAKLRSRRHPLNVLRLDFSEPRQKRLMLEAGEFYPDYSVWQCFRAFNHLCQKARQVEITGSLPECFTGPIVWNMTLREEVEGARPLLVENAEGEQIDVHNLNIGTAMVRRMRRA